MCGSAPGHGWRGKVTLFRGTGAQMGEEVRPRCGLGVRGEMAQQYGERRATAAGSGLARVRAVREGYDLGCNLQSEAGSRDWETRRSRARVRVDLEGFA